MNRWKMAVFLAGVLAILAVQSAEARGPAEPQSVRVDPACEDNNRNGTCSGQPSRPRVWSYYLTPDGGWVSHGDYWRWLDRGAGLYQYCGVVEPQFFYPGGGYQCDARHSRTGLSAGWPSFSWAADALNGWKNMARHQCAIGLDGRCMATRAEVETYRAAFGGMRSCARDIVCAARVGAALHALAKVASVHPPTRKAIDALGIAWDSYAIAQQVR